MLLMFNVDDYVVHWATGMIMVGEGNIFKVH